jgi:CHAD domain-containing protein
VTPRTSDRVTPLLQQRIKALFRPLPKALAGGEDDLHQMRVAARRLRVAIPLLADKPSGRRVRRTLRLLRGLCRTGGLSRDLDVGVALLDAELARIGPTPERRILRRRLVAARSRARTRMAEALLDLEIARLRRDLRVLTRRADGFFAVSRRLRESRTVEGAALLAAVAALADRFEPAALHRIRRQVRRLRYAAEVSASLRGQPAPAGGEFRTLQDHLGRLHDSYVLSAWFARQAASCAARGDAAVAREAKALHALFLQAAQAQHREFLALPPADIISRALASMGGQSRPAA